MFFARIAGRLLELGRPDEAALLCERNIGRNPNYLSGLVVLGQSYLAQGENEKSREVLNLALKQDPDNLKALYLLGQAAQGSGEILLALSYYERVLEVDPYCEEAGAEAEKLRGELESREFVLMPAPKEPEKAAVSAPAAARVESGSLPQREVKEVEKVPPAFQSDVTGEFMAVKEVGVETHLVGMESEKTDKLAEPMTAGSSTTHRELETPPPAVSKPLFETASIAEIYTKQGLFELALRVYRKLLNSNPDETLYKTKIAELEQKIQEQKSA